MAIELNTATLEEAAAEIWNLFVREYEGDWDPEQALEEYDNEVEELLSEIISRYDDEDVVVWGFGTYKASELLRMHLEELVEA